MVVGLVCVILVLALGLCVFLAHQKQTRAIESRIKRWTIEHDLSESQIRELWAVEREFHRSENPFSYHPKPTTAQLEAHRREIDGLLNAKSPDQTAAASPKRRDP